MSLVLSAIRQLITETGCAVLLVHHTRKGDSWNKSSRADAESADARGSSAIIGDVDHVIAVKALPVSKRKEGEVQFWVENPDTRLGAPFQKKLISIRLEDGTFTEFDKAVLDDGGPDSTEELLTRIEPLVPDEPQHITRDKLTKALHLRRATANEAIDLGIERGLFRERVGVGISKVRRADDLSRESSGKDGEGRKADLSHTVPVPLLGNGGKGGKDHRPTRERLSRWRASNDRPHRVTTDRADRTTLLPAAAA